MSKWNLLQNGVSPSEAMVTTRGVWRWEGKDLKIATSWPKAQELEKQLKDKLIYNELQIEHCANDLGICPEIFKDEARLLSSALIGVSYQPLASKFLGGSVQAIEASLLTEVMATEHQGFFENTAKHIEKINGTLSGEKLEIQYSDPETRVTVEVLSTGERQVKFRYVLDTNANPGDGRIYFTDYFSFTKGGKYQPKKFLRYFNHSSSLLTPQRFMNWAGELNKLGSPEISRQKSFAEKVVRKVLPKITEKFSK